MFQGLLTRGQVREADATIDSVRAPSATAWSTRSGSPCSRRPPACAPRKEALAAAEEALAAARERLRLADGRYTAGVGSIIELSDAERRPRPPPARSASRAEYALATARAALVLALGRK